MKKVVIVNLILLVIIMPSSVFAQRSYAIDKGSVNVSGNIEIKIEDLDVSRENWNTVINMNPSYHHFVISNFGIGAVLDLTIVEDTAPKLGIGPSVAYYFGNPESRIYKFIGGKFINVRGKDDINDLPIERDWKYQISVGITSIVAKNVGLTCEGYYQYEYIKTEGYGLKKTYYLKTFGVQLGLSYFIF